MPATKRLETFCPTAEFSAIDRIPLLSDSAIKKERSILILQPKPGLQLLSMNCEWSSRQANTRHNKPARRLSLGTVTYGCIIPPANSETVIDGRQSLLLHVETLKF
jgi:hypothetical protein